MNRTQVNLINIPAYQAFAPAYSAHAIADIGRYPVPVRETLDDGRTLSFLQIDSTQYKFESAFINHFCAKNNRESLRMLDIGFGGGATLRYFAELDYETHGVDFSPNMCELVKTVSPASKIHCSDIFDIDFPDEYFDAIVMMSMICQLPNADAAALLARVKKWLKPGGVIYVSTSVEQDCNEVVEIKKTLGTDLMPGRPIKRFRHNYTLSGLVHRVEQADFNIEMSFLTYDADSATGRKFHGHICRAR